MSMLTRETMKGIYVIAPTPLGDDRRFDEERMRRNVQNLCEAGVDAIVTTGSVGEFHTITWEDHKRLIDVLVDEVSGGTRAVAGCSGVNTEEAIKKTKYAQDCGADAVMNVSPYYVNVTEKELIGYWRDLAEACPDIGLIVYNNPYTAQLHTVETFKELAKIPSMCGSKEITTIKLQLEIMRYTDLTPMTATELDYFYATMKLGAKGIFSMSASMFPRFIVDMYRKCTEGKWDEVQRMQYKLKDVWNFLDGLEFGQGYGAIPRFKAYVNAFGVMDCGIPGKPFIPVPKDLVARYREEIEKKYPELIEL